MLGLSLRKEFQGKKLKGTAIDLIASSKLSAAEHLEITYPSADVLTAVEAIGPGQARPVVLIGERGQGKSHLMAVIHHALHEPAATQAWLQQWAGVLGRPNIGTLPLRPPMHVVTENLHKQSYKFLWDLLFDRHPNGVYVRGKWEGQGAKRTAVPSHDLLMELFDHTPTALVLDEFQTWADGLLDDAKQKPATWAFNFIQMLAEIAEAHPDRLLLVVSVRNGNTEAFRQIHRNNPRLVDFKGARARSDRLRLLLHRLFENRLNVTNAAISEAISGHIAEYLRLRDVPPADYAKTSQEIVDAWPFSLSLMELLEDQVLVATSAQETRDLIRILADLFKRRGDAAAILTAADFQLDDDDSGITALLDSVSNAHHAKLREKAQRNLSAVAGAVPKDHVPNLSGVVGALWLRSLAVGNHAGGEPRDLHLDVTRGKKVDDNAFELELNHIVENSFNIHREGAKLVFKEEENPQAKLLAHARNERLFNEGDRKGTDRALLAKQIAYVLGGGEDAANRTFRVVVLGRDWSRSPWEGVEENDLPERWDDRLPLVVLPAPPANVAAELGVWLKDHLTKRRNTVRFLLPKKPINAFDDRDLLVLTRATLLANEWRKTDSAYVQLATKYQNELRAALKTRFDRVAVLATWNFQSPNLCTFRVESVKDEGAKIPEAIDTIVRNNLFIPEDFEEVVIAAATENQTVGKMLAELQEPRPNGADCIPWLGETQVKERLIRPCAQGTIAINLRGLEYLQRKEGEDEETAFRRMKGRLGTGKHLDETHVLLPHLVPSTGGVSPPPVTTTTGQTPVGPTTGGGPTTTTGGGPTTGGTVPGCGGGGGGGTTGGGDVGGGTGGGDVGGGLFGGGGGRGQSWTPHSTDAPTSGLNLYAKAQDEWGINTGTKVRSVSVSVTDLNGAQLHDLLKKLPGGVTYSLTLEREDES